MKEYDAIIIGAGPNGLSSAITIAKEGLSVLVIEGSKFIGGGVRSDYITAPDFKHDICSAFYPLGISSPFFKSLNLESYGLEWIQPTAPVGHPLDHGESVILERSISETADNLGIDKSSYTKMLTPLVSDWPDLVEDILSTLRFPKHPLKTARFGLLGVRSALGLAESKFKSERARALFTGIAAHASQSLDSPFTAGIGLTLNIAGHSAGWPIAKYGSQSITNALEKCLLGYGGKIETGNFIASLNELPKSKIILCDITPKQLVAIAKNHLDKKYIKGMNKFRYGSGVFKVDWALSGPVPWKSKDCVRAGTIHLGGTSLEIANSEKEVASGKHPDQPYVLIGQQSLFDDSRAPDGKQTLWGYCHIPNRSTTDMTAQIESQIERFAPGFRDLIIDKTTKHSIEMQEYNPNYIGGDINGGVQDFRQLFTRPNWSLTPYATPTKGLYLCSASTPPGGGVHGMSGYLAAKIALKREFNHNIQSI